MNMKQAKAILFEHGMCIKRTEYNEYRVNFSFHGRESTAYYTADLDDAVATGVAMAQQRGTA